MSAAVVGGVLMHSSPSQIERLESCPRSWWWRYVQRVAEPDSPAQAHGTEGHAQIAAYLTGGDRPTRRDIAARIAELPAPGPDLVVERNLALEVEGVPFTGKIDLISPRGEDLELVDWKFANSADWIPEPSDLKDSIQLAAYASLFPELERVRLTLRYFIARPSSTREVSAVVTQAEMAPTRQRIAAGVRLSQRLASVAVEDDAPANTAACGRYGGCYYRDRCSAAAFDPLTRLLGGDMASSLLTRLKTSSVEAAALAAAERRAALAPDVLAACAFFESCADGRPQLAGAAAQAWGAYSGIAIDPRAGFAGTGALGALDGQIETVEELVQIAAELRGEAPTTAPEAAAQITAIAHPASVLPPDAPVVAPHHDVPAAAPAVPTPTPAKAVRRKTKIETITEPETITAEPAGALALAPVVVIMVNVSLSRALGQPLREWVDGLLEAVCAFTATTTDPRLATEGPAAYNRWAVLVETLAQDVPPVAGLWVVDCRDGDQLTEAALRGLSRRDDVLVIRGR